MAEEIEDEEEDEEEEGYKGVEKISVSLPSDLAKATKEYAKEKRLKRSQVVKKALEQFFEETEEPDLWENTVTKRLERIENMLKKTGVEEPKGTVKSIETEKIQELIEDCTTDEGKGFEIDGEDGFLAQCEERELIGDVWTEDNLKIIASYLKKGYDNYSPITQPEREELIEACVEAMELNDKQKETLSEEFGKLFEGEAEEQEEEEEEEEEW